MSSNGHTTIIQYSSYQVYHGSIFLKLFLQDAFGHLTISTVVDVLVLSSDLRCQFDLAEGHHDPDHSHHMVVQQNVTMAKDSALGSPGRCL